MCSRRSRSWIEADAGHGHGGAGFTVSVADRVTPPAVAEMVADVEAVTDVVVIVKLAGLPAAP